MTADVRPATVGSAAAQATPGARRPFQPTRGLVVLGSFAGFGVAVSGLYALTGVGFPCPFRSLTGWDCPLCGGTRLGAALLHGQVGTAFAYNPAVFLLLAVLTLLGGLWIVEAVGGPRVRLPRRWTGPLLRVRPTTWTVAGVAFAVIYTLLRNLL